jgi:hypothetical protein
VFFTAEMEATPGDWRAEGSRSADRRDVSERVQPADADVQWLMSGDEVACARRRTVPARRR